MFSNVFSLNLLSNFLSQNTLALHFNTFWFATINRIFTVYFSFVILEILVASFYNKKIKLGRHLLASLVFISVEQAICIILTTFYPTFLSARFEMLIAFSPLYFIPVYYLLFTRIAKLDKYRIVLHLPKTYNIMLSDLLMGYVIHALCIFVMSNDPQHSYIVAIIANCLKFFITFTVSAIAYRSVRRKQLWLSDAIKESMPKLFINNKLVLLTITTFGIYLLSICLLHLLRNENNFYVVIVPLICLYIMILMALIINYLMDINHNEAKSLRSKNLHINSLIESIDKFREVKQNIHNVMQAYDGYMKVSDYESLKDYHDRVYSTTKGAGDMLDISSRLEENPALYSVLISKINKAHEVGIYINVCCTADASRIKMNSIDLSRTIGILLDNAIEATVNSDKKTILFSTEIGKENNNILVAVSNPISGPVNESLIFDKGYTTKENHTGLGLHELWNLSRKIAGFRIRTEFLDKTITFYLELPCEK